MAVSRFPTCTVTNGVFAQYGQITQVDAICNSPGGAYAEIKFSALQSEQGGIVGNVHGQGQQLLVPRQHRRDAGPEIAVVFG